MILTLFLIIAATLLWAFRAQILALRPATAPPETAARKSGSAPAVVRDATSPVGLAMPFVRANPDLEMIEWQPQTATLALPAGPRAEPEADTFRSDPLRLRLRERYIQARFPGVVGSSADLEDGGRIVTAVRLYFEEQKFDRADELLDIAIGQSPDSKQLRLAQLELAFLRLEGERFTLFARAFRRVHPEAAEWEEIARLGRAIAPMETSLFGDFQDGHDHERYGPWPDMPNWLQASWDLTAAVLASDFHREMAHAGGATSAEPQRSAA